MDLVEILVDGTDADRPIFALSFAFLLIVVAVSLSPRRTIIHLATDDAFYYAEIARNIATGVGITFDGIHPTNGFQPLWTVIVIPVYFITERDWLAFRLIVLLQGLCTLGGVWFIYWTLRSHLPLRIAILGPIVLILNPYTVTVFLGGTEAAINLLLLSYSLYLLMDGHWSIPKGRIKFGLVLGATFLARTDNVFFVAIVFAFLIATDRIRTPRAIFEFVVAVAVLPALYVLWNLLIFGHLMPVSAEALSGSPTVVRIAYIGSVGVFGLVVFRAAYKFKLASRLPEENRTPLREIAVVESFVILAHIGFYLFLHGRLTSWYFVTEFVGLTIIGALGMSEFLTNLPLSDPQRRTLLVSLVVVGIICSGILTVMIRLDYSSSATKWQRVKAANWAKKETACDAVIASQNAGMLGYFSHRSVVETLGLANSHAFLKRYGGNTSHYIRDQHPDYFIDTAATLDASFLREEGYTPVWNDTARSKRRSLLKPSTFVSPPSNQVTIRAWQHNSAPDPDSPNCAGQTTGH